MSTLGGNVCIRNGFELDYCWREAVTSLLPICDKVVISDCESTDGTWEYIQDWAKREPKLVLHRYPWTDPKGSNVWWPEWLNIARQHLPTDMHIQLDADEVLHQDSYDEVLKARDNQSILYCTRFNFWRDPQHLIPEGKCCGRTVLRIAPTNRPIPSDYPYPPAEETMGLGQQSTVKIMHYGFLRQHDAFFRKARTVQKIWANSYDPRLEAAEKNGRQWASTPGLCGGWENQLDDFTGTHPEVIKPWLRNRGYNV